MRIQPTIPSVDAIFWQVMASGVREVVVRGYQSGIAQVSRRGGPLLGHPHGAMRAWAGHATPAPFRDLFASEADARTDFRRRCDLVRSAADRRCLRIEPGGPLWTLPLSVVASAAIGLWLLALFV